MEPGSKGRLATKASNFSKELNEDLLCKVFGLRDVTGHSQAERVNPAIVPLVKLLEGYHVALSRFLRQRIICFLVRLDFGCGHVFVLRQATKNVRSLTPVRHDFHESAVSRERQPLPQRFCEAVVALIAGVMRRFERVVALPDPKDIEFPQPHQHFPKVMVQVQ